MLIGYNMFELIKSMSLDYVNMNYSSYGRIGYVTCTLKEINWKAIPVSASGKTDKEALNMTLDLLDKVKALNVKIEAPALDSMIENGNKQRVVKPEVNFNYYANFKKINGIVAITNLYKQDMFGFQIHDNPKVADLKVYKPYDENEDDKYWLGFYKEDVVLSSGEKLYAWDTVSCLSGNFGIAVLDSENRIVRSKMLGMS